MIATSLVMAWRSGAQKVHADVFVLVYECYEHAVHVEFLLDYGPYHGKVLILTDPVLAIIFRFDIKRHQ